MSKLSTRRKFKKQRRKQKTNKRQRRTRRKTAEAKGGFLFSKQTPNYYEPEIDCTTYDDMSPEELQEKYKKCCPRKFGLFKNTSTKCKNIEMSLNLAIANKKLHNETPYSFKTKPVFANSKSFKIEKQFLNTDGISCDTSVDTMKTQEDVHKHYYKCCPKTFNYFPNMSPYCKKLKSKYTLLQERKQVYDKNSLMIMPDDSDDTILNS
jgi:hypothetical protein